MQKGTLCVEPGCAWPLGVGSSWLCVGFALVLRSRGDSLVAVHKLLIAVAFLVAERGLQGSWASAVTG